MAQAFLTWHDHSVSQRQHARQKNQRPCLIWFTGLSGAGKSTLANALEQALLAANKHSYLLDGDNVRLGLNKDLGFSDQDRVENIRRIAEVSRLMVDAGLIVISAFISPFEVERKMARALFPEGQFYEIHLSASIDVCETRDPKGLYKKARAGELSQFTGIDSPYEVPSTPDLIVDTANQTVDQCVSLVLAFLHQQGVLSVEEASV